MQCYTLFSGSSGNCIYLKKDNTEILIDAGKSAKQINASLKSIGTSLENISAIYITHEHSDHVKGLGIIAKNYKIPIYATIGVAKEIYMECLEKGRDSEAASLVKCIKTIKPHYIYETGNIALTPFKTPHDSKDSVGYIIGEKELGIATDIGHISDEVFEALKGCKNIIIESNHDVQMLINGSYPYFLKERVLSDLGHLSNAACAEVITKLVGSGCVDITLFHLSEENNRPELAFACVQNALIEIGAAPDRDFLLRCSCRNEVTAVL